MSKQFPEVEEVAAPNFGILRACFLQQKCRWCKTSYCSSSLHSKSLRVDSLLLILLQGCRCTADDARARRNCADSISVNINPNLCLSPSDSMLATLHVSKFNTLSVIVTNLEKKKFESTKLTRNLVALPRTEGARSKDRIDTNDKAPTVLSYCKSSIRYT